MKPAVENIRVRAYFIWISEGKPEGRAAANWEEAEIIEDYEAQKRGQGRMRLQFPHGNLTVPFRP